MEIIKTLVFWVVVSLTGFAFLSIFSQRAEINCIKGASAVEGDVSDSTIKFCLDTF